MTHITAPDARAAEQPSGRRADGCWLGVDAGTQGVRAVLVDADGVLLGSGQAAVPTGRRDGRVHEQDPDHWWTALCVATSEALRGRDGRHVVAAAVDSTSGTVAVQDRAGRTRGAALMYDDSRAAGAAERVAHVGGDVWSSMGYRMQPSWALPKVVWLLEHDLLQPGDRVAHQGDVLGAGLTGTPVATDTSSALKTGYDLLHRDWPRPVLDALGVPAELLPEVVLPGTPLGTVCAAAAAQSGIPEGTVLLAGMTDGCAAQIAARALTPGSWSSALGTTLVVKGSTPELLRDPTGAVYCHLNPDGGWLPGGASSIGAGVVAEEFAGADLAALTAAASRQDLGRHVTYPLRGRGERFPFVAPDAAAFDEHPATEPAGRFASVLHGIALVERLAYDVLGHLGADVSGPVTLSGGATRNRWWNQLRADVLGRPVLLPEGVEAALGMAVLAAAPAGRLGQTAEEMVRIAERLEPDPARAAVHDDAYARLVDALARRGWLERAAVQVPSAAS